MLLGLCYLILEGIIRELESYYIYYFLFLYTFKIGFPKAWGILNGSLTFFSSFGW